jgi:hypothetical protein
MLSDGRTAVSLLSEGLIAYDDTLSQNLNTTVILDASGVPSEVLSIDFEGVSWPVDVAAAADGEFLEFGTFYRSMTFAGRTVESVGGEWSGGYQYLTRRGPDMEELDLLTAGGWNGEGFDLEIGPGGMIYLSGHTEGEVQFGERLFVEPPDFRTPRMYFAAATDDFEPRWLNVFSGTRVDFDRSRFAVRPDGGIVAVFEVGGDVILNGNTVVGNGADDQFRTYMASISADGNLEWIRAAAPERFDPMGVALTDDGRILISAHLDVDFLTFGGWTEFSTTNSVGILEFTPDGTFLASHELAGPVATPYSTLFACDTTGDILLAASYHDGLFIPGTGTQAAAGSSSDMMVASIAGVRATGTFPASLMPDLDQKVALTLYPNPASDQLSVEVTGGAAQRSVRIAVFDPLGRSVLTRTWEHPASTIELDISRLSTGTYFLSTVDANGVGATAAFFKR